MKTGLQNKSPLEQQYLWVGTVRSHEGAEGRPVERGGVEGRHSQSQASGADADGRTLELELLDQLIHRPQSPEKDEEAGRHDTCEQQSHDQDSLSDLQH